MGRGRMSGPAWRHKLLALAVASCFSGQLAHANPTGPTVAKGQASFATQGNTLTVTNAPGTVINWELKGLPPGDPRPARFERAKRYRLADLKRWAGRFGGKRFTVYVLGHRERTGLDALKPLGAFEEAPLDSIFPY